jgi:hypothetical protein
MKIRQKNREKTPRKKLLLPYASAAKIARFPEINSTENYVYTVVRRWNLGDRLVGQKSTKIIKAIKAYK